MAEKQIVRCIKPCWDGTRCIYYMPGDQDAVDPERPIAQYFEGWAPGTKVYWKKPGNKRLGTDPEETFRIIPGKVEKQNEPEIWDFRVESPKAKYTAEQRTILHEAAQKVGLVLSDYDTDFKLHKAVQDAYATL